MKIAVWAPADKFDELTANESSLHWCRVNDAESFFSTDADVYMNLNEDAGFQSYHDFSKPLMINNVINTLEEINAPANVIRINGWNGFLAGELWEVSGIISPLVEKFFSLLHKKVVVAADEPGFISARIIAMIINEAFYAKQDKVSNPSEIDLAMKLGTNYPHGPFEWCDKIGREHVSSLLQKLSLKDVRYTPAPGLMETTASS